MKFSNSVKILEHRFSSNNGEELSKRKQGEFTETRFGMNFLDMIFVPNWFVRDKGIIR